MADAVDSKSTAGNCIPAQVRSPAPVRLGLLNMNFEFTFTKKIGENMKKRESRESRKHPRYTKIIQMNCRIEHFPDDLIGDKAKLKEGDSFRATTINVSETGMLINYDFLLPERTLLKMSVS